MKRTSLLLGSLIASAYAQAAPFDTCPSKAYLFQSTPVQIYGVNLVTGSTTLLEDDTGLASGINGVGFNFTDRYIYGYDTTNKKIVRLGQDFQAETLDVSGLPTDHTFYVGDVYNHVYYLYRKGKGLFSIDLSPLDSDPNATLSIVKISSTATVNLTDFAFHPGDGSLYGIDNNSGVLYQFNPSNGNTTAIGDTGELGTFGAGYFDVNGNYYVSRNQDGKIYRVDLSEGNAANIAAGIVPAVEFVSNGPSSSQNDGARCANAPVIDEDEPIDFGDAPDSYHTTLASNGPRHEVDGVTWLGSVAPDGDADGQANDNSVGTADEDGVGFVSALDLGLSSIVNVTASTSGYLSAWFDWNRDGDFDDEGEQVFTDQLLSAGNNPLPFVVSTAATEGSSWSRFRFSQQTGLNYDGGSTSGEVEDYPITITGNGYSVEYFPSAEDYATVAYEDNWPYTADYDMNDVVVKFRITETSLAGHVENIQITGDLAAYGASYKNGFAIRLPGVLRSSIENGLTTLSFNGVEQASNGLESISDEAIFIISEDLSTHAASSCSYFRTESGCDDNVSLTFTLNVYFTEGSDRSAIQAMPYDPFIFATPGTYHGDGITFQPGRKWEVHLADQAPTEQFDDQNLFGVGVDASDPAQGVYFKTANNLPWALLIVEDWDWPLERVDMVDAYPQFQTWAESGGELSTDWHTTPTPNKCYIP
ncbi:LruC domain-containing protein [Vibrio alginolyticus]|uniref:LruC domain-containing protein n=1 Tax=Vibrio alginolyticus TaxID=663 RepID=A0A7Y4F0V6_VIBAL|nr:LruC domain-containing protein [Vibrio alginolyticus]NOI10948.1 LruC domain-containing protein [Vibrio alginolyticus]